MNICIKKSNIWGSVGIYYQHCHYRLTHRRTVTGSSTDRHRFVDGSSPRRYLPPARINDDAGHVTMQGALHLATRTPFCMIEKNEETSTDQHSIRINSSYTRAR